jgi:hypothetical protein
VRVQLGFVAIAGLADAKARQATLTLMRPAST